MRWCGGARQVTRRDRGPPAATRTSRGAPDGADDITHHCITLDTGTILYHPLHPGHILCHPLHSSHILYHPLHPGHKLYCITHYTLDAYHPLHPGHILYHPLHSGSTLYIIHYTLDTGHILYHPPHPGHWPFMNPLYDAMYTQTVFRYW